MDGIPLLSAVDPKIIPLDLINPEGDLAEILSSVLITSYTETTYEDDSVTYEYSLGFPNEVSFNVMGLDGLELVFGGAADAVVTIGWTVGGEAGYTVYVLGEFKLRLKNSLFIPVIKRGGGYIPDPANEAISFSLSSGIELDQEMALAFRGGNSFQLTPVMIGDSGLVIEGEIAFDLSENEALPEALAMGLPAAWKGVIFKTLSIHLPDSINVPVLPDELLLENFSIGNGGISGSISGSWTNSFDPQAGAFTGSGIGDLFGIAFALQELRISFQQNTLSAGALTGSLLIPFFEAPLQVEITITNDGDLAIALSSNDGLLTLEREGVVSIEVASLEFIKEGEIFAVKLSGEVIPLLAGLDWPSFELKGLTIGSDGTVRVEGGWIELPEQKGLDFHGFKVEIARLGFGSDELEGKLFRWIGFSGGIQIIEALPLRGGVEGLKVMWAEDGEVKLKIGGVYLSFEVKDVLTFDGSVYFIDEDEPEPIKEFRGSVDLNIIPVNLGVDAQFITGKQPDFNYFYIAVGLDLPVGIPLGPPVLGLYGLAGLYGQNMTLDYQALVDYEDVADRPDLTDAGPDGKWIKQKDAMAFGAGLTVGTLPDVKFTVKAKVLFVILIPGPVLLIEGHAGMLSLGENYLMRVLAVLDPTAGTFLMNISAAYQFPKDSGDLLDVAGAAEAYFSAADPGNWHLYLGEDEPESKRIRADILNFFKAQTYLMVDKDGLLMGAWIGYELDEKYGILRVVLEAWMGGELGLSTMPLQAKGSISLYGNAELSVRIVSLGISVEANVTVEAPRPLSIFASLHVQLKTPLGKPEATIKLKWEKTGEPAFPIPLSPALGIEHRKVTKNWEIPKYSEYGIDNDGLYSGVEVPSVLPTVPVVPPDVSLVLKFDKPVIDSDLVGANPSPIPTYEKVGEYEFKYELKGVTLQYRDDWGEEVNDSAWEDYVPSNDQSGYALSGYWQAVPSTEEIVNSKLVLNASTPFEISRLIEEEGIWYMLLDVYNPDYPCTGESVEQDMCADFEARDVGTYYATLVQDEFIFTSPFPMVVRGYLAPWLGTRRALTNTDGYETVECLNIRAVAPSEEIKLKVIDQVMITAGVGHGSYMKFTNEYSRADTELFINQSALDLDHGILPVYIHFPKLAFEGIPHEVWITCIVGDTPGPFLYAFDEDGNVVDQLQLDQGTETNGASIYKLKSITEPIRRIGLLGQGIRILEICYPVHHTVTTTNILVTLPEEAVKAEVHLSKNSQGTIYLYNTENSVLEQVDFNIPADLPNNEVQPVTLVTSSADAFRAFLVMGRFDIIRVCGVTLEAQEIHAYNAGLSTHLQASLEENWGTHTAQILAPNKYYRLEIKTATSRRKNGGSWDVQEFTEYMFFKTGYPPGPPAPTQTEVDEAGRYDLDGPLVDLSAYIDYTIPAGAAADEAQPFIYRSYDMGVVYNDSYIDQMYQMAEQPIRIRLLDNNHQPVTNAAGEALEFVNLWGDNPELALTREETHYQDILNDSGCVTGVGVTAETNTALIASSRDLLLSPQIQYRAQVLAGEKPVYEFAFLTSRYANFLHHLHSFQDAIWDHFRLLQNPDYEIDAVVLEQILTNSEEESVKFEQLMVLFDLNPRTLPERIEIALMNDRARSYGLLLESPEPLDWDRTELKVLFADRGEAIEEFDGLVKIIDGRLGNPVVSRQVIINRNDQWVDLLVLETSDLSGFTVEVRPASASEDETYQEYYHFPENSFYLAGTLVRIYNGSQPTSPAETEAIHLYADHQTRALSTAGARIRLKDANREILHTRLVLSDSALTEQDSNIIRNQDGTRALIFIKRGNNEFSELEHGIQQLSFTFKRDIGPDAPVLKRFGFDDAEETYIEFSLPGFLPAVEA